MAKRTEGEKSPWIQRLGIAIAACFFVYSAFYVHMSGENQGRLDLDMKVLTVAHWQMEDGAREGWNKVFRAFEKMKAEEGVKVKIHQNVVPNRGYNQWFLTQLIGQRPADIVRPSGPQELLNRYFTPLSAYVDEPNPFNVGTPLEGIPWKDTFLGGMEGNFNTTFSEYYTVPTAAFTTRLFGNLDLIEEATGKRKMPDTLTEWLEMCQQLMEYGKKNEIAIMPVAGRLSDVLYPKYFSMLNGNILDKNDPYYSGAMSGFEGYVLGDIPEGDVNRKRLFSPADVYQQLAPYVDNSYDTMSRDQLTYLFYAGRVGVIPSGSWDAWSIVQNSTFEVGISQIPIIGPEHKYHDWFTGQVSEGGSNPAGTFAIAKGTAHPELALELLHFMTSHKWNQVAMHERKWLPAVKFAEFPGILEYLKFNLEGRPSINPPYFRLWGTDKTRDEVFKVIARILKDKVVDQEASEVMIESVRANQDIYISESTERLTQLWRNMQSKEAHRSHISMGLLRKEIKPLKRELLTFSDNLAAESLSGTLKSYLVEKRFLEAVSNPNFMRTPEEIDSAKETAEAE